MSALEFTEVTLEDVRSAAFMRLELDLDERLARLREANDSFDDEPTTIKRRGRIAEVKELLALIRQSRQSEDSRHPRLAPFRPR